MYSKKKVCERCIDEHERFTPFEMSIWKAHSHTEKVWEMHKRLKKCVKKTKMQEQCEKCTSKVGKFERETEKQKKCGQHRKKEKLRGGHSNSLMFQVMNSNWDQIWAIYSDIRNGEQRKQPQETLDACPPMRCPSETMTCQNRPDGDCPRWLQDQFL